MVVEVGRGGEAFAADWALVRLLTRMNPPVRVERAGRWEALAAHIANVRLFTCEKVRKCCINVREAYQWNKSSRKLDGHLLSNEKIPIICRKITITSRPIQLILSLIFGIYSRLSLKMSGIPERIQYFLFVSIYLFIKGGQEQVSSLLLQVHRSTGLTRSFVWNEITMDLLDPLFACVMDGNLLLLLLLQQVSFLRY